jgi:hypothetical protein
MLENVLIRRHRYEATLGSFHSAAVGSFPGLGALSCACVRGEHNRLRSLGRTREMAANCWLCHGTACRVCKSVQAWLPGRRGVNHVIEYMYQAGVEATEQAAAESIAIFEKDNPDIRVERMRVQSGYRDRLVALIAAATVRHVVNIDMPVIMSFADERFLHDLRPPLYVRSR